MKRIRAYIDKYLGYLLIIPAITFILLFSILPIIESTKFSFFDFQLNDQQKSGLYFGEHLNVSLINETYEYIDFYLSVELDNVQKESTKSSIEEARNEINEDYKAIIKNVNQSGAIVKLTDGLNEVMKRSIASTNKKLNEIFELEDSFATKEDIMLVAGELNTAIIDSNFVGVENFVNVFKDSRVWQSLTVTLFFTVISVFLELLLGLALALIMNKPMRGRGLVRTFSLIPWAIPTSVAALMWAYLYNGSSGIIALITEKIGLVQEATDLMLTSSGALWSIIFADVWKTTPYMALLLLAGLQIIPGNLYESSSLDGANKIKQFFYVTLPLLKPSILVALLFRTLDSFRVFDLIWVLTGGGPGGTTESISIYAYKIMFAQTRFGYGAAIVLIMALFVGVISYLYIKFLDVQLVSE